MNKKNCSILFCALLASTFVHELRAKWIVSTTPQISSSAEINVLEVQSTSVVVQVQRNVLIISNSTAGSALLIDVENNKLVLLNGTSGSSIAVDRKSNTGSYIPSGAWNSDSQSLEQFVSSLNNGLADLLIADGATQFELASVSEEILIEVTTIVTSLTEAYEETFIADLTLSLNLAITIFDGMVELFGGVLLGMLELFGDFVISLPGDICAFLNTLQGIASIIEKVCGSYSEAIEQGVEIQIESILGASHGLESFSKLLSQLGEKLSLESLSDQVGDVEGLFKLISQLGGNVNRGVSGSFKVTREIVSYTNGQESLDTVIDGAIKYLAYSQQGKPTNQSAELKETLSELLLALEIINGSGNLNNTVQIVRDLIDDNLIVQGINISQVIDLLLGAAFAPAEAMLEILVDLLLLWVAVIDLFLSIPYLLVVLISKLASPTGIAELQAIGIEISESFGGTFGGVLKLILSGMGNTFAFFAGNFFGALSGLTVIGDIVEALNNAVEKATHGENSLQKIFESNPLSRDLILGLFQLISGGQSSNTTVTSEAQKVLETSNSVNTSINVDIISVVQVSSSS